MRKLLGFIQHLFFAAKVIVKAVTAPVISLIASSMTGQPIRFPVLLFALWRLFVWLFFLLCVIASIGVPAVIAYLFLIDLGLVGLQIVNYAAKGLQEKTA